MAERGEENGLTEDEVKTRVESTLRDGKKQILTQDKIQYTKYFQDNLTFRVVTITNQERYRILTVIIQRGRP